MNRRDAISRVALLVGGTVVGSQVFLTGCRKPGEPVMTLDFSPETIALLDEVGETILPATPESPGAKATAIGLFMKTIVNDCYSDKDQIIFREGIGKLQEASDKKYSKDFMSLAAAEKHDLLVGIDQEMKEYAKKKKSDDPNHYFSLMKQLTLWGYFTSEEGSTKALRFNPVPGHYSGCAPYKKGDRAWAAT